MADGSWLAPTRGQTMSHEAGSKRDKKSRKNFQIVVSVSKYLLFLQPQTNKGITK